MCDAYGKEYFSKRMFTNEINMRLPRRARAEMTVHGMKTRWLSGKNILDATVSKESHVDNLLGHEQDPSLLIHLKKKLLPIANSFGKINLIYWITWCWLTVGFWGMLTFLRLFYGKSGFLFLYFKYICVIYCIVLFSFKFAAIYLKRLLSFLSESISFG